MKIAALTLFPSPYFIARYSAFVQRFPQHLLQSIEFGNCSAEYGWKPLKINLSYKRTVLSEQCTEQESPLKLAVAVWKALSYAQPDAVAIAGYAHLGMLTALVWTSLHRKSAVLFSDSKGDDTVRQWWKELPKRFILKFYQTALVAGKPHRNYLVELGLPADCIFSGYDVVGNDEFRPAVIRALPNPLEKPFFLTISRFVPKKNISNLLTAYAAYCQQAGSAAWDLVLCGDGPLRSEIERQIQAFGIQERVHLPGFLQQEALLPFLAHTQCLIHASLQEQWGLVVNEAMAAGLPVLVSNRCGCFEELVVEGVNGFGFDPEDIDAIAQLMLKMSSRMINLEAMGQASLQHIQAFSPASFADGLHNAVQRADLKRQPSGVFHT